MLSLLPLDACRAVLNTLVMETLASRIDPKLLPSEVMDAKHIAIALEDFITNVDDLAADVMDDLIKKVVEPVDTSLRKCGLGVLADQLQKTVFGGDRPGFGVV